MTGPRGGNNESSSSPATVPTATAASAPSLVQAVDTSAQPSAATLLLGRRLASRATPYTGEERIRRSHRAGLVARQALETDPFRPLSERTADIGLPPRCFVVLFSDCPSFAGPVRFGNYGPYLAFLGGEISAHHHVSHGFASIIEAEVYCLAAGRALPALHQ